MKSVIVKLLIALLLVILPQNLRAQSPNELEAYTQYQEWHFEMRFTREQRLEYQNRLMRDFQNGKLVADIKSAPSIMAGFARSDWMTIFRLHSERVQVDNIELSTEQMLNNGQVYGTGIAAQTRKEAKSGIASSQYLLQILAQYQRPAFGNGNVHTSIFPKQVDATFEWTAFKIKAVTGSEPTLSNAERAQMWQSIRATANANKDKPENFAKFKAWLDLNLNNWLIWRVGGYSFLNRMTPYQKIDQITAWAIELAKMDEKYRAIAQTKVREYQNYVSNMSNTEVQRESELKKQSDTKFANEMARMQNNARNNQITFAQMRNSLTTLHAANLNISENIGNTGYVWKIR